MLYKNLIFNIYTNLCHNTFFVKFCNCRSKESEPEPTARYGSSATNYATPTGSALSDKDAEPVKPFLQLGKICIICRKFSKEKINLAN
jgi:hypothetical protein